MALDDFDSSTDGSTGSNDQAPAPTVGDEAIGSELEDIITDAFDDMDADNSKSFHYEDDKVVVDRDELVEDVMLMCAMTVRSVNK